MKIIKLTAWDGTDLYINCDKIVVYTDNKGGNNATVFTKSRLFHVKQSAEEIDKLIYLEQQ